MDLFGSKATAEKHMNEIANRAFDVQPQKASS
jgi:hypothetical protein